MPEPRPKDKLLDTGFAVCPGRLKVDPGIAATSVVHGWRPRCVWTCGRGRRGGRERSWKWRENKFFFKKKGLGNNFEIEF